MRSSRGLANRDGAVQRRNGQGPEPIRRVGIVARVSTDRQAASEEGFLKNQLQRLRQHIHPIAASFSALPPRHCGPTAGFYIAPPFLCKRMVILEKAIGSLGRI